MEKWTIKQLKEELKIRGASLRGKKAALIERLQAYIANNNFVKEENALGQNNDDYSMVKPPSNQYRDVNGDTKIPNVTSERINLFLSRFGQTPRDDSMRLYKGKYLQMVRYVTTQTGTFVRAVCRAQMKQVCYHIDILIQCDGCVLETQCECAAGQGPFAHCKHIVVVLLALLHVIQQNDILLAEVCTQRLQTFHKPKRPFHGSPQKAKKMRKSVQPDFDPRPLSMRNNKNYVDYFKNVCVNYSASNLDSGIPIMHAIMPANPYGTENDHDYTGNVACLLYKHLGIAEMTLAQALLIEKETRGQIKSPRWTEERSIRITSSKFKYVCCATERCDLRKLALGIINPIKFTSKPTEHGIVNEPLAIQKYTEVTGHKVKTCGLITVLTHPYLAASPDGLVDDDLIVEVKCPYTCRDKIITQETVPYLELVDDELSLKKNHAYYYQVMGQLLATNAKYCDFVVYTYKDIKIIRVCRDQDFIECMLVKLVVFFDTVFSKCLKEKYLYKYYT